jgi:DNA-binding MarR family transcriptional regulator
VDVANKLFSQQAAGAPSAPAAPAKTTTVQERVLQFVVQHPGSTITDVARYLQCSHTTAAHHLFALQRKALVTREVEGRSVRHYSAEGTRTASRLRPFLGDERQGRIVGFLRAGMDRPATPNEIAKVLRLHHGYVLRALKILERHGFVQLVRLRSRYHVQATSKLADLLPAPTPVPAPSPPADSSAAPGLKA